MFEAIFVAFLIPQIVLYSDGGTEREAIRHASLAYFKQTGMEAQIKTIEKRYVKDEIRNTLKYTFIIQKVIQSQKVEYAWRF